MLADGHEAWRSTTLTTLSDGRVEDADVVFHAGIMWLLGGIRGDDKRKDGRVHLRQLRGSQCTVSTG